MAVLTLSIAAAVYARSSDLVEVSRRNGHAERLE